MMCTTRIQGGPTLNFTYTFRCYQQNCSWLHFSWTTLYIISQFCFICDCYRYPVILSFENHCSVEQQKIVAQYLTNILGGILWFLTYLKTYLLSAFSALTLLVGRQKGHPPVKNWVLGAGVVICLGRGADLKMAQLMPLPLTLSCSSKSRLVLPSWFYLSGTGSPG